jgi:hypothetical protein
MGNIYGRNFISDIVESCTLESTYVNENTNSPENDVAKYSLLSLCGFNTSVFIGGYWASNQYTDGICLGYDVNSNVNIGVPTIPLDIANQNSMLSIGVGGIFGTALLGSGGRNQGQFTYGGYFSKIETTNAPTAVGGTTISLGSIFGMLASGYTITDLTNPTAIPSGTTVTAVNRGAVNVTISNPVASPGVAASDKINFSVTSGPAPCLGIVGGVDLLFSMSTTCFNGSPNDDFALKYDPSVRAWTLGSTLNSFLWIPTSGYAGYDPTGVVAPYGFAIGSAESYGVGRERTIDISTAAFSNDSHREGDVRFNRQPTPGGNLAWSWASAFTTTFSAPVAVGATTATVAACPSPALPAGTPIDYANFDDRKPVGDLASCVGTTLTFQAPAVAAATSGWQAMFMQSRQAAHIANDAAGTSWPVATLANVSGLAPCNATTVGFGVAYDGETYAAKGYGTAVAGGGATHRPVFCDGTSWTYH